VNCQDVPIADFVDGDLDPAEVRAVERHLEGCAGCRTLVADLRTIRAAAFTLDRREPPADLLTRIRARAADEPARRATLLSWPNTRPALAVWLAAAAALILATVIGVLPLVRQPSAPDSSANAGGAAAGDSLVDSVEADLAAAQAHYEKAIQGLEEIARRETSTLDPQVAAVLQKNLQVIDQAIGESRVALRSQPSSTNAQDSLFEAMRNKVALLQQTVELINEVRKGNQAEAGRLMQDMNR
jgi:anti-sigma factor RsiW